MFWLLTWAQLMLLPAPMVTLPLMVTRPLELTANVTAPVLLLLTVRP